MFNKTNIAKSIKLHGKKYGCLKWTQSIEFQEFKTFIMLSVDVLVEWFKRNYKHIPLSCRPEENDLCDYVNF